MAKQRHAKGAPGREPLVTIDVGPLIWTALNDIAAKQARSVQELIEEIARDSLYAGIRVYIAEFYRYDAPADEGGDPVAG